jgi:hypothetical protein
MNQPRSLAFEPTLLRARLAEIEQALPAPPSQAPTEDGSVPALHRALAQNVEVIARVEAELAARHGFPPGFDPADVTQPTDYALSLIEQLGVAANRAGSPDVAREIQDLAIAIALWSASRGGRLERLEVVVNAFAERANALHDPDDLGALSDAMGTVIEAVVDELKQDLEKTDALRPWRILNLNRAIVATRSHDPARMESAFAVLVANLPEDARGFFPEGMEEMDRVGYPPPVRAVMTKYFEQWGSGDTLH